MYELHFIDLLLYYIGEELGKPWKTSNDKNELEKIARELRDCANENHKQIEGYWAQIWIESENQSEITHY